MTGGASILITLVAIYVLIDPRNHEIRYVGWTAKRLEQRLAGHLRERATHHRACWIRQLKLAGHKPLIQLLQNVPETDWPQAERYWISYFRAIGCALVNGTDGGEGTLGQKHTATTREKMSAAKRGRPSPFRGKQRHSAETRARLSAAAKRQMANPAQRAAVSKVHRGKSISKAHRNAVGKAATSRWARWRALNVPSLHSYIRRYENGEGLAPLASEIGISAPALRGYMNAEGVVIRGRAEANHMRRARERRMDVNT